MRHSLNTVAAPFRRQFRQSSEAVGAQFKHRPMHILNTVRTQLIHNLNADRTEFRPSCDTAETHAVHTQLGHSWDSSGAVETQVRQLRHIWDTVETEFKHSWDTIQTQFK